MSGIVFDIQRFSIHDGPGIRTTVFLKGCNMHCAWCHNPESFQLTPQLGFFKEKCTGCAACATACPNGVHSINEQTHTLNRDKCIACGACVSACVNDALKIYGKRMSAAEVLNEVEKDSRYYKTSGGGVTFSGGEATLQQEFLLELLKGCKERGFHTAIETNGFMATGLLEKLCMYTDVFLFDYKVTGEEEHKRWTGVSNGQILNNLEYLYQKNHSVILRCPMIPGVNDVESHFEAIRELKRRYPNILQAEIMPYHNTGKSKWEEIGMDYSLKTLASASDKQRNLWSDKIK